MKDKFITHLRNATRYRLMDRDGTIGMWIKWPGGWLPVVLRNDLWKAYL